MMVMMMMMMMMSVPPRRYDSNKKNTKQVLTFQKNGIIYDQQLDCKQALSFLLLGIDSIQFCNRNKI